MRICPLAIGFSLLLTAATVASQGTDLGGGVVTRLDVEYLADLSLDVRDMKQFVTTDDGRNVATEIYVDGRNAETQPGLKFPLRKLSETLASNGASAATPNYMFHLYGLSDRSIDLSKLQDNALYADAHIRSSILAGEELAPMAALVLSMWMYATHVLHNGVDTCQKLTEADNPQQFDLAGGGMDEFIALWIGTGQKHGSSEGSSLYALAQDVGGSFGSSQTEVAVNRNIKLLYQEGASLLSRSGACSKERPETAKQLWSVASRILAQAQIPIMQLLIQSIVDKDADRAALFALAVVPQAAQCRPSTFKRLRENLLSGNPNFSKSKQILKDLQEIYPCLGFTCDDIGSYGSNEPVCESTADDREMAQYKPSSGVQSISRIDLDILQLRILTSLGSFRFAKIWYLYGRNSPMARDSENDPFEYYSLSGFATSASRQNAEPTYSLFAQYHNDANYADKLIRNSLEGGTDKWGGSASVAQRSAFVTETSAFQVLYMHTIAQINDAVNACYGTDEAGEYDLTHPWDEVAALVIGSLEGPNEGGSSDTQDGQLIWGLGNRHAFQFQTLNRRGYSKINSKMESYLFAGKGELDAPDCLNLENTAEEIRNSMLVPLMQSTLRFAIQNEGREPSEQHEDLALGEAYALAIIPIIENVDPAAAQIIKESMLVFNGTPLVRDGSQAVADALGSAADAVGVRCESLGVTSQADPCKKLGRSSSSRLGGILSISLAVCGALGAVLLM